MRCSGCGQNNMQCMRCSGCGRCTSSVLAEGSAALMVHPRQPTHSRIVAFPCHYLEGMGQGQEGSTHSPMSSECGPTCFSATAVSTAALIAWLHRPSQSWIDCSEPLPSAVMPRPSTARADKVQSSTLLRTLASNNSREVLNLSAVTGGALDSGGIAIPAQHSQLFCLLVDGPCGVDGEEQTSHALQHLVHMAR